VKSQIGLRPAHPAGPNADVRSTRTGAAGTWPGQQQDRTAPDIGAPREPEHPGDAEGLDRFGRLTAWASLSLNPWVRVLCRHDPEHARNDREREDWKLPHLASSDAQVRQTAMSASGAVSAGSNPAGGHCRWTLCGHCRWTLPGELLSGALRTCERICLAHQRRRATDRRSPSPAESHSH
jgi:hypothetical protein